MKCDNASCPEKATETRERRSEATASLGHSLTTVFRFCEKHAERYDARQTKEA